MIHIKNFDIYKICMPTIKPLVSSYGYTNEFIRTLIHIKSENHEGWGEIYGDYCDTSLNKYKHKFINKFITPKTLEKYWDNQSDYGILQTQSQINNQSLLGIEMALNDITSQKKLKPLYKLLRQRNNIKNAPSSATFSAYSYNFWGGGNIAKLINDLKKTMLSLKSDYVEFKLGIHGVEHDIKTVHAIRKEFGDCIEIGVDINMKYDKVDAYTFLLDTKNCNIITEEPVSSPYEMNLLAKVTETKISTHCTDPRIIDECEHIYGLVPDVGIERIQNINTNKSMWLRSAGELGIGFANMCHHIMSNNFDRPSQTLIHLAEDDLLDTTQWEKTIGGFKPKEDMTGLGIKVDLDKVLFYNDLYNSKYN